MTRGTGWSVGLGGPDEDGGRDAAARRTDPWAWCPGVSWGGVHLLALVILMEPGRDQAGQRLDGRLGVGAAGLDLQPAAALGGQGRQVEDALAVVFATL